MVGVDASAEMVKIAEQHEADARLGILYLVDDAQTLEQTPDAAMDGVTCQLGLTDIPDLHETLRSIHRVLKPSGWFVFVIGHPCFLAPDAETVSNRRGAPARLISSYFDERFWRSSNPNGVRRAGNYHRMLSTYLNALSAQGFALEVAIEPVADKSLESQQPEYRQVPMFFAGRARRSD